MATSCSTTQVAIDVLASPENKPDKALTSCGWINRVNPDKGYIQYYINGSFVNKTNVFNEPLGNLAMRRIEQYSNDMDFITVKPLNYKEFPAKGQFKGPLLSKRLVKDLCDDQKVNFIIALEGFNADIDVDQSVTYSPGVDRNFGVVSVPMFDGMQTITMQMFFRIYDRNGSIVHSTELATQEIFTATGDYPGEMQRKLRNTQALLDESAEKLAQMYQNEISPHWIQSNRSYYKSGSQEMAKAEAYVNANNWEGATDIWYKLAESDNKRLAKRASFNMIVASEVAGDFDLAIKWAQRCINKYRSNKALTYLALLKKRKQEHEEILKAYPLAK